jgi:hypothetical protein
VQRTGEAACKVKAVAIDADVGAQPVEPLADALAHELLRVVDVGRCMEKVPCARVALPAEVAIIPTDGLGIPVQPPAKLQVHQALSSSANARVPHCARALSSSANACAPHCAMVLSGAA